MPFQSSTQCEYQFNDLDRYSFQTMMALALVSLSLPAVSAARFQLDDLAGETMPLSHILTYLNESSGPKPRMDLETVVAIWCSLDSQGLGDGEIAAIFEDKNLRLDILEDTFTSTPMHSLDHHQRITSPEDRFEVEKIKFSLHSPYLQQVPAVCKAFYEECIRVTKRLLFEGVSPGMVISPDPSFLLNRRVLGYPPKMSEGAKNCVEEVLREMVEKFDWTHDLSYRTTLDSEGRSVGRDVCAGHSYFSQCSRLLRSLPFNPHLRGPGWGLSLCQVVLHGKNPFALVPGSDDYSNFVTLELSLANNDTYSALGYELVHDYAVGLDGVRRGDYFRPGDDDGGLPRPVPRSLAPLLFSNGRYLHQPHLSTDLPGTNMQIDAGGVAQEGVIEEAREYNRNFLAIWTEQKEGIRNHLLSPGY